MKRQLGTIGAVFLVFVLATGAATLAQSQNFTVLHSFTGPDGASPVMVLLQGINGNLYGTTGAGGANNAGTLFEITTGGTLTTLYNFCSQTNCTDGALTPLVAGGGLVLATDGNFYGTTQLGGANSNCNGGSQSCGTVFKITSAGTLTTLHSFSALEGSFPNGLVQATDGNFYGTAQEGGANNAGAVFRVTPVGNLTTLYSFCSQTNCTDGGSPIGALVQATDGNLYGTTFVSGVNDAGGGTVFKITLEGTLTTLATVGGSPSGTLVQATDGNFYGTTSHGGTVFKMAPDGTLTTLGSDCCFLYAGLAQATDGNFYGTTFFGGSAPPNCGTLVGNLSCGSIYQITPQGALATLYSFCPQTPCTDSAALWPDWFKPPMGTSMARQQGAEHSALARSSACPWGLARWHLLNSGVLTSSQAASLTSAAQSVIAAL